MQPRPSEPPDAERPDAERLHAERLRADGSSARRVRTLGAFHLQLGEGIDADVNARVHALSRALAEDPLPGVTDVVPSYANLFLEYDRDLVREEEVRSWARRHEREPTREAGRSVTVPVRYDGPDLAAIAAAAGTGVDEVIRRHAGRDYRVYALGFTPGFPFMGEVDPLIRSPRLAQPRPRVEAHTVAIADAQTGIYPLPSPGGWRLLGTALEAVYDPHRERPFLLDPGDTVRFEAADGATPEPVRPLELLPSEPRRPVLRVREPGLIDLMVDGGRLRAGRFGLARSGPLDARSARLANRLVGNRWDAPLLELNVSGPTLEATADAVLAFAGWGVAPQANGAPLPPFESFAVAAGDVLRFPPQRHGVRGYLAVAGGFESGTFLGSASVDSRGLIGRPLREGDVLGAARSGSARSGFSFRPYARFGGVTTLRLEPGPQANEEALAVLTREPFRVQHADRMGMHLDGAPVPGGSVLSEANPLGAVQVAAGGKPLVLLHDRGTIGGYQKPAVVHPADLPRVGQLRAGDRVRFVRAR